MGDALHAPMYGKTTYLHLNIHMSDRHIVSRCSTTKKNFCAQQTDVHPWVSVLVVGSQKAEGLSVYPEPPVCFLIIYCTADIVYCFPTTDSHNEPQEEVRRSPGHAPEP